VSTPLEHNVHLFRYNLAIATAPRRGPSARPEPASARCAAREGSYHEFTGGHDVACWRGSLAGGIIALAGAGDGQSAHP